MIWHIQIENFILDSKRIFMKTFHLLLFDESLIFLECIPIFGLILLNQKMDFCSAVSSLPSLALWHSRLGHAPSSRVQQLTSKGLLGSVSKDNFDCTSCQLGK